MDLLENLNSSQREAVLHTEGPLLILAGAGSGKTRVITHRIAYLVRVKRVQPWSIFAVTFTNKAAGEMKTRIINMIGPEGNSVFIKTFHSAAVQILRRFGERIGIPRNFSIYDQSDQESLIKQVLLSMRLDPKKVSPGMIASKISGIKDRAEFLEGANLELLMPSFFSFNFSEVYRGYHDRLRMNNALDFDDLLIKTVELLRSDEGVLTELRHRWRYHMIDEYQDTNYAQYLIAKYLSSSHANICVVGDDDQSIYSWRGADIRNILNFEKDYPGAKVVTLEYNYRSREPILNAASAVIRNNIRRKEKNIKSSRGEGEAVVFFRAYNEYREAEFVVSTIVSLRQRERLMNRDFAVFYRTNAQSRVIEEILLRENIPYRVVGGLRFYDRREIRDILAYLRFVNNPRDTVSLLRIINTPARGIGKATIDRLREIAEKDGIRMWEVIEGGRLPGKIPAGLARFRELISRAITSSERIPAEVTISTLVRNILEVSGYRKSLEEEETDTSMARLENIDEFLNSVYEYETQYPEKGLDEFLQDISLLTTEENPEADPESRNNRVSLLTVHNAKGLEFPVVFLTGMEENVFPHRLSIDTEAGLEEERRLCYVGITRAMDRLYLSCCDIKRSYRGEVLYQMPSRFIGEIPEELIEEHGDDSSGGFKGRSFGKKSCYAEDAPDPEPRPPTDHDLIKYKIRDCVTHPKYGFGTIVGMEGSGDNLKLTIAFKSGKKSFLEKYAQLEKTGL